MTHRELAQRRRLRHRPRGPGQAGDRARLARAGRVPRDARVLHGRQGAAADRAAADRRRAPGVRARRGGRARDAAGPETVVSTLGDVGCGRSGHPRAGDHARRRRRRRCASSSPGSRRGRCTAAPSRSRARGRRRSALAARLRDLGAAVVEAPAIRTQPLEVDAADVSGYDLLCVTSPTGADELFRAPARRPRPGRRDRRGDRPGHGAGPARARDRGRHRPERAVAEGLSRRSPDVAGARGAPGRARRRGPRRPDRRPARARRRGRRRSRSTRPSPEPLDDATRARPRRGRLPALHLRLLARASSPPPVVRSTDHGWCRSARRPARSCASTALEPDLEADPHTPDGLIAALLADAVTSAA